MSFSIEHRVLAGIQFEDASTGAPVRSTLDLQSEGLTFILNRRHIHVVSSAVGLEDHSASFEAPPPPPPAVGALQFRIEVRDPSARYLPRSFVLALPRSTDPEADDALLSPVVVPLYRSPLAERSMHWSMVRVRLTDSVSGDPVPAAFVRIVLVTDPPSPTPEVLGIGMSVTRDLAARELERRAGSGSGSGSGRRWTHFDERHLGETAIPVVGLSASIWSEDEDEVTLDTISAAIEVLPIPASDHLPDPSAFMTAPVAAGNRRPLQLALGEELIAAPFAVTLP